MRYLAIDHGTKHCGWSAMYDGDLKDYGSIDLNLDYPDSLVELWREVDTLMCRYVPEVVVLEAPMQLRNGKIAQMLIEHFAVCKIQGLTMHAEVVEVSPPTMKLHVAGHGKASKDDVAWAVSKRFGIPFDEVAIPLYYKDKKRAGKVRERLYDTADAIGLAWAAWQMAQEAGELAHV